MHINIAWEFDCYWTMDTKLRDAVWKVIFITTWKANQIENEFSFMRQQYVIEL